MKYKQKLSILITLFAVMLMKAQEFQGVATYKSYRKVDFKIGESKNSNMSPEMQKQLEDQIKKQAEQDYTLSFNKNESIYRKNETLEAPTPSKGGLTVRISDPSNLYYKNLKEHRFANQTELYGKEFLIKDSLKVQKWELLNETKNIGQYTCFKAQYKDEVKVRKMSSESGMETTTEERITTAWYTPQIPVSNGPSDFSGLPGLILEINDGKLTLICSKIVINPEEEINIKEPKKGKEVTQKEFNDIMEKKSKEMMDQMRTRGSSNGSEIMVIGSGR